MNTDGNTSSSISKIIIKGKNQKYGLWIHKNKWHNQKFADNQNLDIQIGHKSGSSNIGIMTTFTDAECGLNNAKTLTIQGFKKQMPDLTIESEEMKWVNNNPVLHLKIMGTINYVPMTLNFYLYSGKIGTIQICALASNNLFEKYKSDLFDAMGGFVVFDSTNGDELLESTSNENNIETIIESLNNLRNKGLITKEEYDKKKSEILNKL